MTTTGAQLRNQMYTDFHNDVVAQYGVAEGPARVVKILGLIEDLTVVSFELASSPLNEAKYLDRTRRLQGATNGREDLR